MQYYWILLALLAALTFAQSENEMMMLHSPHQLLNNTPSGLFNHQTQKCCLGNIHQSIKADYQKCCGGDVYDSSKKLCCHGTFFDIESALTCCGNGTMNTDQSICCEGQKVDVPQEDASLISYAKCCGLSYYDPRTQTCCGKELYDEDKQVCCATFNGTTTTFKVVSKDGDKTWCCGEVLINPNTEHCCKDQVVYVNGCCGDKAFDTSTHICCDNKGLAEKTTPYMSCCGEKPYAQTSHGCCQNPVTGSLAVVPNIGSNETYCCGFELYDKSKHVCCYDTQTKVVKLDYYDDECCGTLSFNSIKQFCCAGKVHDFGTGLCCGHDEVYDPATKLCCLKYSANHTLEAYALADNPEFKLVCCGSAAYDPNTQMCCADTVVPLPPNGECCGKKSYDFHNEVCCTGTVFPKQSNEDSCCFYGTTDAIP